MTPQELKNSVLQLAIQGRLVEQRPEEGTAQELYQQIQAEKQRLIKDGKIKTEKPLPEITEDEKPFEIPGSWMWVGLTDCGCFISGYTPKQTELTPTGDIPYFKVSDMNTTGNELYLKKTNYFVKSPPKVFFKGTIVYPKNGGAVFTNKKRILDQNSVVDLNTGGYYPFYLPILDYLYYFFLNIDFRQCYKGTALPTIDMDRLKQKLFPLPPLAEQKRIVAKIEELLPYIDRYEQAWSKLEQFNTRFPEDMKKSILQYAIQGKLVEQRPEEGTAQELYQQIQGEKQRLIKEGKIKKEKPLPEITEDEIPFEIPESWMWVRLQQIGELSRGRSQKRPRNDPALFTNGTFPFIQTGDVARANGHIAHWTTMYNQEGVAQSRIWPAGTVCLTIAANIGDVAILDFDACFPDSVVGFNAYRPILSNEFFMYGLMCYKTILDKMSRSTAQKNINIDILSQIAFPLPPLAEQKRIVARLEELLPLCERLK